MLKQSVSRGLVRVLGGLASLFLLFAGAEARADQASVTVEPPKKKETGPTGIDLSALVGGAIRLGDAPLFDISQRGGWNLGLGLAYVLHPISVGLSYDHVGLGREDSGVSGFGTVHISRAVDTVWASVRIRFEAPKSIVPYFGVGIGAAWQSAQVGGIFLSGGGLYGGRSFGCSATDSVNLAFRANAGAEVPVSKAVSFVFEGSFDAYRLSSEVFENCAPGAGTTSAILLRAGLTYRFDLSEGRQPAAPPAAAQVR